MAAANDPQYINHTQALAYSTFRRRIKHTAYAGIIGVVTMLIFYLSTVQENITLQDRVKYLTARQIQPQATFQPVTFSPYQVEKTIDNCTALIMTLDGEDYCLPIADSI